MQPGFVCTNDKYFTDGVSTFQSIFKKIKFASLLGADSPTPPHRLPLINLKHNHLLSCYPTTQVTTCGCRSVIDSESSRSRNKNQEGFTIELIIDQNRFIIILFDFFFRNQVQANDIVKTKRMLADHSMEQFEVN